jgi:hypothetical protein
MKKLVFASALAIGSLTIGTAAAPIIFHDGIMEDVFSLGFKEIAISEVPESVIDALEEDYEGASLKKAFVNEERSYNLEVLLSNGTSMELYSDAEGNWLEI